MAELDNITVLSKREALRRVNLSLSTWDRLEAAGDTPPKIMLSAGRVGYRVSDLSAWLDGRKERPPPAE